MSVEEPAAERVNALAEALGEVTERIRRAAEAAGRDPADVQLLPVTKFFPASDVLALYRLGCRAFGESRDQEAAAKTAAIGELGLEPISWHMVGSVQRNKARSVAGWAHSVHSVDSERLVSALDGARAQLPGADPLQIYVQVSLDGDIARGGIDVDDATAVDQVCEHIAASEHLRLAGLMALPPRTASPEHAFGRLQQEHWRVCQRYPAAGLLSAGMSADLETAVKYGSTCVRVGTALMGQRPLTSR